MTDFPLKHFSPSALNLFKSSPALWVGKYLLGWRDEAGAAAWRGSAVEAGLDVALYGLGDGLPKALERFELDAQGDASEEVDKHRKLIPAFLAQALEATKDLPQPTGRQFKVEHRESGLEAPFFGFVDYVWPDWFMDLKTTERLPSEPRADHVMQMAIYSEALQRPAKLLYVTPKKSAWYEIGADQRAEGLAEAVRLARNIQRLLALSSDPRELLASLPFDFDNFRWNDNLKQMALQAVA